MSRKSQRKSQQTSQTTPRSSRDSTQHPLRHLITGGFKWILVGLLIPVVIGLIVLGVELFSEKPALHISSTGMPETDYLVFYKAIFENKVAYTNDRRNIRIDGLPPFDDLNPIFGMSDLPALEFPVTLINTGRKPSTAKEFRLTLYSTPALVSNPGVILDSAGQPSKQNSAFLDIGQEQTVVIRFSLLRLEEGLERPPFTGLKLANPILFRGMMRLVVTGIEHRTNSAVIEFGQAKVDEEHYYLFWVTSWDGNKGPMPTSGKFVRPSEVLLDTNPYIIKAYVKAGAAYIPHECLDCAFAYLNYVLKLDPLNADAL